MTADSPTIVVKRITLLRLLRHCRAPYAENLPDYEAQVTVLFDSIRKVENRLSTLLGQKHQIGMGARIPDDSR